MVIQKRQTPDIRFTTLDGLEIGLGEIKPFNTPMEDIETDRIRLAEISKKMLHRRILQAKPEAEFKIFCVMFHGYDVEYYVHQFLLDSNNDKKYLFRSLMKSTIPAFPKTFSSMMLSLESLFHFKVRIYINIYISIYSSIHAVKKSLIEDSLSLSERLETPYSSADAINLFMPTVILMSLHSNKLNCLGYPSRKNSKIQQ
jgi:hypothetical protein